MMTSEDPVTIGPGLPKIAASSLFGVAGIVVGLTGVLVAIVGYQWLLASGWVYVAIAGGLAVVCGVAMLVSAIIRNRPRVEVHSEGFVAYTAFGARERRWADIEGDFTAIKIGFMKGVGYHLTEAFKKANGIKPTKMFEGKDEVIADGLRSSTGELAEILNQWKRRASGSLKKV